MAHHVVNLTWPSSHLVPDRDGRVVSDVKLPRVRVSSTRHRKGGKRHDLEDREQRTPKGPGGRHDTGCIAHPRGQTMSFLALNEWRPDESPWMYPPQPFGPVSEVQIRAPAGPAAGRGLGPGRHSGRLSVRGEVVRVQGATSPAGLPARRPWPPSPRTLWFQIGNKQRT